MDSFRFYSWFWFAMVPVVLALVWFYSRSSKRPASLYSSISDLKSLPITLMQRVNRNLPVLFATGLCLMVAGLARPQSGKSESRISGQGIAIELVLDVSGSMEALDFQLKDKEVSRLEAVKHVVSEFISGSRARGLPGRKNDLVGLVAFCGFADSKCPLTLDHGALVEIVKSLEVPKAIRDRRGKVINEDTLQEELATAIGDGVALGIDRLKDTKAKSKVLVLLTDGDNNAGVIEPREAAAIAKELGIKLYTIGIGRNGTVPFPREDEFGRRVLVGAQFRIDEALLKEMGESTGATYFHASDADGLAKVYAQIDQMERSEFEESKFSQYTELFRWFGGAGLALVLGVYIMKETRFRSLP
jgi:Ca-activated chloride channel homolog